MSGTELRSTAVTARVGMMLGIAVTLCFVTGLISHFIQHPQPWFYWPAHPVWLYRLTQGTHVASGIAAIPLTVVKLWSVWPKLFERPIIGGVAKQLERASILVLVGAGWLARTNFFLHLGLIVALLGFMLAWAL